jgi:hypothetical protein
MCIPNFLKWVDSILIQVYYNSYNLMSISFCFFHYQKNFVVAILLHKIFLLVYNVGNSLEVELFRLMET